jgi:hypothetical protein
VALRAPRYGETVRLPDYFILCREDVPVFLLGLLVKGERVNMSMAEKRELKRVLATIASSYRANLKSKVAPLVETG